MFMEAAYKELKLPVEYFNLTEGVDTVNFCKETMNLGDTRLATDNCPEFVTDIVLTKNLPPYCEIHTDGAKIKREDRRGDTGW
jgi:hypothetical protein